MSALNTQYAEQLAQATASGNEVHIRSVGKGWNQQADLVAHPQYGVVVRKSMKHPFTNVNDWYNDSDQKVLRHIKVIQDTNGRDMGFARIHGFDNAKMTSYSAFVPGVPLTNLDKFKETAVKRKAVDTATNKVDSIYRQLTNISPINPDYYTLHAQGVAAKLEYAQAKISYIRHKATFGGAMDHTEFSPDQEHVIGTLRDKGFSRVFDHTKPWNVIAGDEGAKIIDVGGDYLSLKNLKNRHEHPLHYFYIPNTEIPKELSGVSKVLHDVSNLRPAVHVAGLGIAGGLGLGIYELNKHMNKHEETPNTNLNSMVKAAAEGVMAVLPYLDDVGALFSGNKKPDSEDKSSDIIKPVIAKSPVKVKELSARLRSTN